MKNNSVARQAYMNDIFCFLTYTYRNGGNYSKLQSSKDEH